MLQQPAVHLVPVAVGNHTTVCRTSPITWVAPSSSLITWHLGRISAVWLVASWDSAAARRQYQVLLVELEVEGRQTAILLGLDDGDLALQPDTLRVVDSPKGGDWQGTTG